MAATVLLLLFLVFVTACPTSFALHLSPTSAKIAAYPALNRVGGFSNPHLALVTPAPHIQHQGLFERDTSTLATCGYVSGDAASPLTCPKSYSCLSTVQYLPGWACCNEIKCVGNYHTCNNYGEQLCENLDDPTCSSIYTSILSCSSANPSCFAYARSSSLGATDTRYSLGCGKSTEDILALVTTTGRRADHEEATATGASSSSVSSDVTSPGGSQPSSKSSGDSSNSWSQGTIVGVSIAAAAAVVAIIVAWWKKHQVLWLITCGCYGNRHSQRPTKPSYQSLQRVNLRNINPWHSVQPPPPPPPPPPNNFTFNINNSNQQLRNGAYQNGPHGPIYY